MKSNGDNDIRINGAAEESHIAREAGLRYVTDSAPGITREGEPGQFRYRDPSGKLLRKAATLKRIRALVIPPAWSAVWICAYDNGHLQATGRDARGRKQYRYHAHWRATRDANKYELLNEFVRALPRIRAAVKKDLHLPGMPRRKILAAVVSLLEATLIRVGNEKYARDNGSFGLTTMRNRHIKVRGERMQFDFRGKSGKQHRIELVDARLAGIVRRCRELPGQELFQYLDDQGVPQNIDSSDVNAYLAEISGADYTAKDFRTWAGTVLAALALRQLEAPESETARKKNITQAITMVAQKLGNTPAICRKCYVHPGILAAYPGGLEGLPGTGGADFATLRLTRAQEMGVLKILFGDGAGAKRNKAGVRKSRAKTVMPIPPQRAVAAAIASYN